MNTDFFNFDNKIQSADSLAIKTVQEQFQNVAELTFYNQQKVLKAFIKNGVSDSHFAPSTGYGYGDRGRDTLEAVFADCVGAEDSLIRHNFVSGTHTLTVGLFGILRPGDKMLCVTGRPYDTLIGVLGIDGKSDGSLSDFGVEYSQLELQNGKPDIDGIKKAVSKEHYKMVYVQRSRGYSLRPTLSVEQIGEIVNAVKEGSPETLVFVDNCYGEFTERQEPTEVGADIIAGSLIKNPGGGIAPTGGYIAGKKKYIEMCANRLTCPGVGREVGCSLGHTRELFMGLFAAPHVVGEALKTAIYASALFKGFGYNVTPEYDEIRHDIIEAICLENEESLIAFCQGLQKGEPIDSFAEPQPWDMPGYDSQVIMAAGTFTNGASIELSADAPLREPFAVWMQGGLNFDSARIGILYAAQTMLHRGVLKSEKTK